MRGATCNLCRVLSRHTISIHAPRVGCDVLHAIELCLISDFNPRTPCGVRPATRRILEPWKGFQSTHPVRGATRHRRCCTRSSRFQSTHPVRGATVDEIAFKVGDVHFNPRTPCGVRLRSGIPAIASGTFQSTHPVRGATRTQSVRRCCKCNFNPRTPCGVRRCRSRPTRRSRRTFQSTHPVRGATRSRAEDQAGQEISIHAPRAGCDAARRTLSAVSAHFNPRTPCGVRREE